MSVTSSSATIAPSSAADAPENDFHSVLASYAQANAAASPVKSVQTVRPSETKTAVPKAIEAVRRAPPAAEVGNKQKVSAKSGQSVKPLHKDTDTDTDTDTDAGQTHSTLTRDKPGAKPVRAAEPAHASAPSPAVQPAIATVSRVFVAQTVAQEAEGDDAAPEAPSTKTDVAAAEKSSAGSRMNANPLEARDSNAQRDNHADTAQIKSAGAPQDKPALSKPALDAIMAIAKTQTQETPKAGISPAAPSNPGSIAAMLNAVRGTIAALIAPKQPVASLADDTSAPAIPVVDKKAGEIQRSDAAGQQSDAAGQQSDAAGKSVQSDAADRQALLDASDKIAKPEVAAPAQPAPPGATSQNQLASEAMPTVAGASQSVPANIPPAPTQIHSRPDVQPNVGALAAAIVAKSAAGTKTFDIRMDPPELGRVDIHLSVDRDGKVQALLSAEHPQTLALLQRDSQSLERALKDAGLNLSNNSLNFSLKGDGRQGDGGGAFTARARSLPNAVVARAEAANASEINLSSARGNGRLDIRV